MFDQNVLNGPTRPNTPFTKEQLLGIESTDSATVINSGPGGGKSAILKEIVWRNPKARILYLAYNKSIVEDMRGTLPTNCDVSTFHAFGLRTIKAQPHNSGKKLKVNFNKYRSVDPKYNVAQLVQNHIALGGGLRETSYAMWRKTCDRFQMNYNLIPDAQACLEKANENTDVISASDMLTLPVRENHTIPQYDIVLVDECNDLSLDKLMLLHQIPCFRIFLVGDKNQQINGWAGSDPLIFEKLDELYEPVKYMVNETFRCPAKIIQAARQYVPDLFGSKTGGSVSHEFHRDMKSSDFPPESLILCRANAPLLQMAKMFIRDGVDFKIKPQVVKTMSSVINRLVKKHGSNIQILRGACNDEKAEEILRYKQKKWNHMIPKYKYEAIFEVLNTGTSLAESEALIERLLQASDLKSTCKRQLSSIHTSKGLESENVFFLEKEICDKIIKNAKEGWSKIEEKNLCYVAITRSKNNLVFASKV